nr:SsrA-binding protein SmpB [uncultured Dethiosulfovibrio sp.]
MSLERVAQNRKARHDYFILDTYECGIVLSGTEIKSVRAGKVNLKDGYAKLEKGELWLMNVHISPYENASWGQHEPTQKRKLLMHRREILKIAIKVKERGFTLVPLSIYIKDGRWAKVELGLAKGKALYDKRDALAEKDAKRTIDREMKNRLRD